MDTEVTAAREEENEMSGAQSGIFGDVQLHFFFFLLLLVFPEN